MGAYNFAYGDGYKAEGTLENCTKTCKTIQDKLENHAENVEGGEERVYCFHTI